MNDWEVNCGGSKLPHFWNYFIRDWWTFWYKECFFKNTPKPVAKVAVRRPGLHYQCALSTLASSKAVMSWIWRLRGHGDVCGVEEQLCSQGDPGILFRKASPLVTVVVSPYHGRCHKMHPVPDTNAILYCSRHLLICFLNYVKIKTDWYTLSDSGWYSNKTRQDLKVTLINS